MCTAPFEGQECKENALKIKVHQSSKAWTHLDHLPSGYVKIAIENDHRNSGFSH
jgi:hypothetical protein